MSNNWTQYGNTLSNDTGDYVAMNGDGTIVAVSSRNADDNGVDSGKVRVYQYSSGTWTQLGNDIDGEAGGDKAGDSISLNANGTVIAIGSSLNSPGGNTSAGHVRVYEYNGTSWDQLGNDIDGDFSFDKFGSSVSLDGVGYTLAVGAPSPGEVKVYIYTGVWVQVGSDILYDMHSDYNGASVSLSYDGTIVAIGAYYNSANGTDSGTARVFKFGENPNNGNTVEWYQLGANLNGEAADDYSGTSVSLNYDGTIVAIGAPFNDSNGNSNSGHVRVYQYTAGSWVQLGNDIDGTSNGGKLGYSVSINSNGTRVAIGEIEGGDDGSYEGKVKIYEYSGGSWSLLGNEIKGDTNGDQAGTSVAINYDGDIVIFGSPGNAISNGAYAKVYQLSSVGSSSGDPYLKDINGDLMKLPDVNQKYTLFETENSQLKVEFTTTLLNSLQKVQYWSQCKKFFPQLRNKAVSRDNLLRTFEAPLCFIQNVMITHENKTETYNLFRNLEDACEIIDAENGAGIEKRIMFVIDNKEVVIKLQKFSNPQIITGLSYVIPKNLKVSGLITEASSRKYKVIQEQFITGNNMIKNITMKQLF
jgi:hypothetical protein